LDFTATLLGSRELTSDIVADVKEAQYVTDDAGHLAIPFRLTGSLPSVRPKPDTQFIAQAIAKAAVGKGLEKLLGGGHGDKQGRPPKLQRQLEKILGGGRRGAEEAPPPGQPGAPGAGEPRQRPTARPEDLLRKGLEGLFGR
ncbi:MAG: hypothetical protein QOD06_1780, partial [Candidatus Binatota bacterium]|nr:hypothetical protein [Candidatus Binatota bacterium]